MPVAAESLPFGEGPDRLSQAGWPRGNDTNLQSPGCAFSTSLTAEEHGEEGQSGRQTYITAQVSLLRNYQKSPHDI